MPAFFFLSKSVKEEQNVTTPGAFFICPFHIILPEIAADLGRHEIVFPISLHHTKTQHLSSCCLCCCMAYFHFH